MTGKTRESLVQSGIEVFFDALAVRLAWIQRSHLVRSV